MIRRPTPPRGRCFTPTGIHQVPARRSPRLSSLPPPTERTQCEDLLPALADVTKPVGLEESFCDTLLDGRTYRALVRNLTEEVAVRSTDGRIERDPTSRRG